MEIWDIYDSNRVKTGRTCPRSEKLRDGGYDGDYMLVAMILIFDTQGRMLIQKRPMHLGWEPGKWTMTAGGAVKAGETPSQAAGRELYEELGIKMDFAGKRPNFAMTNSNAFIDYFVVRADINEAALAVPNEEVAAAKWISKEELLEMIDRGASMPYRKPFVEFCFNVATHPKRDSTLSK